MRARRAEGGADAAAPSRLMASATAPEHRLVDRRKLLLTLGAPYALLLLASLVEWPWRALGAPGALGTLTPPSFVLLALSVAASAYALRRKLPLSMITWLPAGQGAVVLLATGFFAAGAQDQLTGLAFIIAFGFVYLLVLAIATAIASNGAPVAIAFVAFFALTQAARFPVFGADGEGASANAGLLTLAAFARAAIELAVLAWLARRLVETADSSAMSAALWIVALTLGHGALAGWEDPALRGVLTLAEYGEQVFRWFMLASIQLGMAGAIIRFRRAQFRDQDAPPERAEPEDERAEPDEPPPPAPSPARSGRPTPRRRRRR